MTSLPSEKLASLPLADMDGTLADRAPGAAGAVRAKTGTLTRVTALSGFARLAGGERARFSILVNGYRSGDRDAMDAVDDFVTALVTLVGIEVELGRDPPDRFDQLDGEGRRAEEDLSLGQIRIELAQARGSSELGPQLRRHAAEEAFASVVDVIPGHDRDPSASVVHRSSCRRCFLVGRPAPRSRLTGGRRRSRSIGSTAGAGGVRSS